MIKVIHSADLHLSGGEDREYGLAVLRELVGHANKEQADFLLFCGDLFDSFKDLKGPTLLDAARIELQMLRANCRALYIPGNHEVLGLGKSDKFSNFNFGRLELCADPASSFGGKVVDAGEAEFVCVPHAADYYDYRKWALPEKKPGRPRLLLMHGLNSAVYSGPDGEEQAGLIPDSLFGWLGADYAALGHVHAAREAVLDGCLAVYPGSARVWRRGEAGPRKAVYFEIEEGRIGPRRDIALKQAGEYRHFELQVNPDGSVSPSAVRRLLERCDDVKRDYLALELTGFAEDENAVEETRLVIESQLKAKSPRRLDSIARGVALRGGLASNALAAEFLAKLEARRPAEASPDFDRWLAARRQGLAALAGEGE